MVRRGGRRVNPFTIEMMTMPQSGLTGYYFPYNAALGGYDTSTYNSSYSDNTVSANEVQALIGEINALPETRIEPCNGAVCCFIILLPLCILGMAGGILGVMLNLQTSERVYNYDTGQYETRTSSGIPLSAAIPIVIVIFLVCITGLVTSICCMGKVMTKKALARRAAITGVITRHTPNFDAKNVILRLSSYGSYIALEFKWRAAAAVNPLLLQQQMLAGAYLQAGMVGGMPAYPNAQLNQFPQTAAFQPVEAKAPPVFS